MRWPVAPGPPDVVGTDGLFVSSARHAANERVVQSHLAAGFYRDEPGLEAAVWTVAMVSTRNGWAVSRTQNMLAESIMLATDSVARSVLSDDAARARGDDNWLDEGPSEGGESGDSQGAESRGAAGGAEDPGDSKPAAR